MRAFKTCFKKNIVKSGLFTSLARFDKGKRIIVLRYHSVSPNTPENALYRCPTVSVTPELFERQISYLSKYYRVISLDDAVSVVKNGTKILPGSVVITFDDGYEDNYIYAYPILRKYGATATFYVTSESIGNERPFWVAYVRTICAALPICRHTLSFLNLPECFFTLRGDKSYEALVKHLTLLIKRSDKYVRNDIFSKLESIYSSKKFPRCIMNVEQIKTMAKNNMTIAAHTVSHPILTVIPDEDVIFELSESKKNLEKIIKKPVHHMAYPNGGGIQNYNKAVMKVTEQAGYLSASTSKRGFLSVNTDLFSIKRQGINDKLGFEGFVWKLEEDKIPFIGFRG